MAPASAPSGSKAVFDPKGESLGYLRPDAQLVVQPGYTSDLTRPFPAKLVQLAMARIDEKNREDAVPVFDVNGGYVGYLAGPSFHAGSQVAQAQVAQAQATQAQVAQAVGAGAVAPGGTIVGMSTGGNGRHRRGRDAAHGRRRGWPPRVPPAHSVPRRQRGPTANCIASIAHDQWVDFQAPGGAELRGGPPRRCRVRGRRLQLRVAPWRRPVADAIDADRPGRIQSRGGGRGARGEARPSIPGDSDVAALNSRLLSHVSAPGPQTDLAVGPGDLIEISVFEVEELSKLKLRIPLRGTVTLPLIGQIPASGRSAVELEDDIRTRLQQKYIHDPQVSVFVLEHKSQRISIVGAVRRGGVYPITSPLRLADALALSEGLSDDADHVIFLIRRVPAGTIGKMQGEAATREAGGDGGAPPSPRNR